jgi:hypothetical protein
VLPTTRAGLQTRGTIMAPVVFLQASNVLADGTNGWGLRPS